MKVNNLSGIVMRVAAILICLVLFSAHLASGMFARYIVSGSGSGGAHIASYDVGIISADSSQVGVIGTTSNSGDVAYRFIVDNSKSDVAVQYRLSVMFSDSIDGDTVADKFSDVKIDGLDPVEIKNETDRHIYVFDITDTLAAHSSSDVHTLTFNTSLSWKEYTDTQLADTEIQAHTGSKYPVEVFADVAQIN